MSKQIKHASQHPPVFLPCPPTNHKILPLKHQFFTFKSKYNIQTNFQPTILYISSKNPKWCHLSLKLGRPGEYKKCAKLRRARSLRLRSIHLESFWLSNSGDWINPYIRELDIFTRAANALKKLSLSIVCNDEHFVRCDNRNACSRLKKFVKKQKHLDEFGLYLGDQEDAKRMSNMLKYIQKTVRILTIANMTVDNIFKTYKFPKLETLRFEYIQFFGLEESFSFGILKSSLEKIMALPSMKTLVFSQYQPDDFKIIECFDGGVTYWAKEKIELTMKFWEFLRAELDKNKEKPLRIKYHKRDDKEIPQKAEDFRRIFQGLPEHQTFEYEVMQFERLSREEVEAQGLEVHGNCYWKGIRYLISEDKVESF